MFRKTRLQTLFGAVDPTASRCAVEELRLAIQAAVPHWVPLEREPAAVPWPLRSQILEIATELAIGPFLRATRDRLAQNARCAIHRAPPLLKIYQGSCHRG